MPASPAGPVHFPECPVQRWRPLRSSPTKPNCEETAKDGRRTSFGTKDGDLMIQLTRLSGAPFVLNADLIERVDRTPDTVITLADGTKYVAAEDIETVVAAVRRHRAEVIALSQILMVDLGEQEDMHLGLASVTDLPTAAAGREHGEAR